MNLSAIMEKASAKGVKSLTDDELRFVHMQELKGGLEGEMPFHIAHRREKCLEQPSYFITEVVDSFYAEHFEMAHHVLCNDVIGAYLIGEDVKIGGEYHDPTEWIGLMVLMSRDTFKSSIAGLMVFWKYLYYKIRKGVDLREMYVHEVLEKAEERGNVMRQHSLHNARFRETFPEFHGRKGEWDRNQRWNWPSRSLTGPTEWSFIAYGQSSKKTGGHYTGRTADDWETESSVTTQAMRDQSYQDFRMMDNLKDRSQKFNPYLICDTTYHHDGTMKRLLRDGGYLLYEVPAHKGSAKAIFDLCALDNRTKEGRLKIKAGIQKLERERPGDLNFPRRLDWNELYLSAKAQGSRVYNGQMLLNPTPEGDQRFEKEDVEAMWIDRIPVPAGDVWCYVRCDPAISKKREADETCIAVGLIDWRGWRWAVDGWIGREKRPSNLVRLMFRFARDWTRRGYKCFNIGVESVAYQEALAEQCREGVPERAPEYHGEQVPMLTAPCAIRSIKRSSEMHKQEWILQMEGPIQRREFKIWKDNPIGRRFSQQLQNFPFDRDDALDGHRMLWEGIVLPPKNLEPETDGLHSEIEKILKRRKAGEAAKLKGTHHSVSLTGWG